MKLVKKVTVETVAQDIKDLKNEIANNPCTESWEKLMYAYELYGMLVELRFKKAA